MRKTLVTLLATATFAGGGVYGADEIRNPYASRGEKFETAKPSTTPGAGENKVELSKEKPEVILKKWDGETALGVEYEMPTETGKRPFLTDRVEWKGDGKEVHAYPLAPTVLMEDGGFEIEVVLDAQPESNVFDFKLSGHEELDFFYQPALTEEEIARGDIRPENVVGSYAVYHKTKKNHIEGQTNYATGKAYHIFRPKAVDAEGNETWAELSYSEGVLTVTVPEKYLATATYPVKVDPTFGYTTVGGSVFNFGVSLVSNHFTSPTAPAYITDISVHGQGLSGDGEMWVSAYTNGADNSRPNYMFAFPDASGPFTTSLGWSTGTVFPAWLPSPSQEIWLAYTPQAVLATYGVSGDSGSAGQLASVANSFNSYSSRYRNTSTGAIPSLNTQLISIYATYTTCDPTTTRCTEVFVQPGYNTWTAPSNVTSADIACWGAGGGGAFIANSGGGGGGGGAFASSTVSVTPGVTYGIEIGAGGASSTPAGGGDSNFASTTVVADGGLGTNTTAGGAGGTTANSTGSVEFAGGTGGAGLTTDDAGGGGGGAGGPHGAGVVGTNASATAGGDGGAGDNAAGPLGQGGPGDTTGSSNPMGLGGVMSFFGAGGGGGGDNGDRGGFGGPFGGGGGGSEIAGGNEGGPGSCQITYQASSGSLIDAVADFLFFE